MDTGLSLRPGATQAVLSPLRPPLSQVLLSRPERSDREPGGCVHEAGGLRLTDLLASADGMWQSL